jgi:hypothetical protein
MPTRMPEFANSYEYASTYVNAQRRDGIGVTLLLRMSD